MILSASLLACRGRVQREGEVIHLTAEHRIDLSDPLRTPSRSRCRMGEGTTLSTGARRIIGQGTGSGARRGTSKCPIRGSARPAPGAGFFFLAVSASSHCCRSCRGTDTDLRGSSGRVK